VERRPQSPSDDDVIEEPVADLDDPLAILKKLKEKHATTVKGRRPPRLPIARIERAQELFQARSSEEDDRHVEQLIRALKYEKALDPLLVMQIGKQTYLLDGHHRWLAYKKAGVRKPVPVEYFDGTIEEAVLVAGRANSKAKLPMLPQERHDYAWKLVLLGRYSKKQIVEAAAVSDGQVAIMRRVFKKLDEDAFNYTRWRQAQRAAAHRPDMSDEERQAWKEQLAEVYADKITKACGPRFRNNTEVAAMALSRYFGRRLENLASDLAHHLPDGFFEPLNEDDCEF
jgi:ParB-like chromosome segregation protein Spo0J